MSGFSRARRSFARLGGGGDGGGGRGGEGRTRLVTTATLPSRQKRARFMPVKIEPKTLFANERTLIQWLSASLLLVSLSLALMGLGAAEGRIAGLIIFPVAAAFLLYALGVFHWRANKIRRKAEGPYDERCGPTVLVVVLLAALITNAVLTASSLSGGGDTGIAPPAGSVVQQAGSCELVATRLGYGAEPSCALWHAGSLWTCSPYEILRVNTTAGPEGGVEQVVALPNMDAEAMTRHPHAPVGVLDVGVEDPANMVLRVNVTSGEVLAVAQMDAAIGAGKLLEGLAFAPAASHPRGGIYYATGQNGVLGLDIAWPGPGAPTRSVPGVNKPLPVATVDAVRRLSAHSLFADLPKDGTRRVSSLFVYSGPGAAAGGTLVALLDHAYQVRAFDLTAGKEVGRWPTPGRSGQWEGVAITHDPGTGALSMWLAKDTPAEVWRFAFSFDSGLAPCAHGGA